MITMYDFKRMAYENTNKYQAYAILEKFQEDDKFVHLKTSNGTIITLVPMGEKTLHIPEIVAFTKDVDLSSIVELINDRYVIMKRDIEVDSVDTMRLSHNYNMLGFTTNMKRLRDSFYDNEDDPFSVINIKTSGIYIDKIEEYVIVKIE